MTITPLLSVRLGAVILAAMLGLSGCAAGDAGGSGNTSGSGSAGDAECEEIPAGTVLTETTLKRDSGGRSSAKVTLFSNEGTVVRMQVVSTMAYVGEMTAESAKELYEPTLDEQNALPGVTVTMEFHKNEWVNTMTQEFTKMSGCSGPDLEEMLEAQKKVGLVEVK